MWHKTVWMGYPMRFELTHEGLQVKLANNYIARGALVEEQLWHYLTQVWENKRVHAFVKSICPKVIVTARPEFELAYYDVIFQNVNHNTTEISLSRFSFFV